MSAFALLPLLAVLTALVAVGASLRRLQCEARLLEAARARVRTVATDGEALRGPRVRLSAHPR